MSRRRVCSPRGHRASEDGLSRVSTTSRPCGPGSRRSHPWGVSRTDQQHSVATCLCGVPKCDVLKHAGCQRSGGGNSIFHSLARPASPDIPKPSQPTLVDQSEMSPSAITPQSDQTAPAGQAANAQVEQSVPNPVYLTTEPKEDFDWKITLKGKVVAITGANRGRCMSNLDCG